MKVNLLVSYNNSGFMSAKNEVHEVLTKLGDQESDQELVGSGLMGVQTSLKSRDVVVELKELQFSDPGLFKSTTKWVPADYWCEAKLDELRVLIEEDVAQMFLESDKYNIEILNQESPVKESEVEELIKSLLKGTIDEDMSQKTVLVYLFETRICVSVVRKQDIFAR